MGMRNFSGLATCTFSLFGVLVLVGCTHLKMGLFLLNSNPGEHDESSLIRGRQAFLAHCARCHGEDADGRGAESATLGVAPTNFHDSRYSKGAGRIAAHISYGKGDAMPAFAEQLPYETIWDVANYLRSLQAPTVTSSK